MKKKLEDFGIVKSVVAIWIISIAAMIILGAVSFYNSYNIYSISNKMNTDTIPKLKDWGDVNANMGVLRNTLTKIIDRSFDEKNEQTMLQLNGSITAIFKKDVPLATDAKEISLAKDAEKAYKSYYSYIPGIIEERKKGIVPDPQITNVQMGAYGTQLQNKLIAIVDYEKSVATNGSNEAKRLYDQNTKILIAVFVISLIIISTISILVIGVIRRSIREFTKKLNIIAKGDFSVERDLNSKNEFGIMNEQLDNTINSVSGILKIIKNESNEVKNESYALASLSEEMNASTEQMSLAIQNVAEESTSQAQEFVYIDEAVKSFGKTLDNINKAIKSVDVKSKGISHMSGSSNDKLEDLAKAINSISDNFNMVRERILSLAGKVKDISSMIELINDIAEQTNLLALNAAIEAARAGEAGRGFAVVAEEIRNLSEQSKNSSDSITASLSSIDSEAQTVMSTTELTSEKLKEQETVIGGTIEAFKNIILEINSIIPEIDKVNKSVEGINSDKNDILKAVDRVSSLAESNSAASEEISASTEEISQSSNEVSKASQLLNDKTENMMKEVNKIILK